MEKLIKLSDSHYVVVDNSEIKEGDYYWTPIKRSIEQCIKKILVVKDGENDIVQYKITHSTEPLEEDVVIMGSIPKITLRFLKIKKLSLSDVEETVYGYNAEKMAKEFVKDKLFIDKKDLQPLQNLLDEGYDPYDTYHHLQVKRILKTVESFVQSLLPKTEWNCKVVDGKIELI